MDFCSNTLVHFGRTTQWSADFVIRMSICLSVRPSMCSSVCLLHSWVRPKRFKISKYTSNHTIERRFSFLKTKFRNPEFRSSPRTSVLKRRTPIDSENRKGGMPKLLLFTHRKLHTGFPLVPNWWPWMTLNCIINTAVILRYFTEFGNYMGVNYAKVVNEDRPALSATSNNILCLEFCVCGIFSLTACVACRGNWALLCYCWFVYYLLEKKQIKMAADIWPPEAVRIAGSREPCDINVLLISLTLYMLSRRTFSSYFHASIAPELYKTIRYRRSVSPSQEHLQLRTDCTNVT